MKSKTFFLIHGNLIGALMGIEGYFISRGSIYAIVLGIILGVYGNLLTKKIINIIKEELFYWISNVFGVSIGNNIKDKMNELKKD